MSILEDIRWAGGGPTKKGSVRYDGFIASFGTLEQQRRHVLEIVGAHVTVKTPLELAFNCVAGNNVTAMNESEFCRLVVMAKLTSSIPVEGVLSVPGLVLPRPPNRKLISPVTIREIFTFVTQSMPSMNVTAFIHAMAQAGQYLHLVTLEGNDPTRSMTNQALMLKRLHEVIENFIAPLGERLSTSYPFPVDVFRETTLTSRVLWRYSEALEDAYDRYVPEGDDMGLGEFETMCAEFGVVPQVPLPTTHRIFYDAARGAQSLDLDSFCEAISRIAAEILSDDAYARWLTLHAKTEHFIKSVFGAAYTKLLGRQLPVEMNDLPAPVLESCEPAVLGDLGGMLTVHGYFFGALGRGVWVFDSASGTTHHIESLDSNDSFQIRIRPHPNLHWNSCWLQVKDTPLGGVAFNVKFSADLHLAVSNTPEDLPFVKKMFVGGRIAFDSGQVLLPAASVEKVSAVFKEGCQRSSNYNRVFLYESCFRWIVVNFNLSAGKSNLLALGLDRVSAQQTADDDDDDDVFARDPANQPFVHAFANFSARREGDGSARAALTFSAFVEVLIRLALSKGQSLDRTDAIIAEMLQKREKPPEPPTPEESDTEEDDPLVADAGAEILSPKDDPLSGSLKKKKSAFGVEAFDTGVAGEEGGLTSPRSNLSSRGSMSRRRSTARESAFMKSITSERKQSMVLRNSNANVKGKLEKVETQMKLWDETRKDLMRGVLEIKGFCELLLRGAEDGEQLPEELALLASPTAADSGSPTRADRARGLAMDKLAGIYKSQLLGACDRAVAVLQRADLNRRMSELEGEQAADGRRVSLDLATIQQKIERVLRDAHVAASQQARKQDMERVGRGDQKAFELMEELNRIEAAERRQRDKAATLELELRAIKSAHDDMTGSVKEERDTSKAEIDRLTRTTIQLNAMIRDRDKQINRVQSEKERVMVQLKKTEEILETRKQAQARAEYDLRELQKQQAQMRFAAKKKERDAMEMSQSTTAAASTDKAPMSPTSPSSPRTPRQRKSIEVSQTEALQRQSRALSLAKDTAEQQALQLLGIKSNLEEKLQEETRMKERGEHEVAFLRSELEMMRKTMTTVTRFIYLDHPDMDHLKTLLAAYEDKGNVEGVAPPPPPPESEDAKKEAAEEAKAKEVVDISVNDTPRSVHKPHTRHVHRSTPPPVATSVEPVENVPGEESPAGMNAQTPDASTSPQRSRLASAAASSSFVGMSAETSFKKRRQSSNSLPVTRKSTASKMTRSMSTHKSSGSSSRTPRSSRKQIAHVGEFTLASSDDEGELIASRSLEIVDCVMQTDPVVVLSADSTAAASAGGRCQKCAEKSMRLRELRSAAIKTEFEASSLRDDLALLKVNIRRITRQCLQHCGRLETAVMDQVKDHVYVTGVRRTTSVGGESLAKVAEQLQHQGDDELVSQASGEPQAASRRDSVLSGVDQREGEGTGQPLSRRDSMVQILRRSSSTVAATQTDAPPQGSTASSQSAAADHVRHAEPSSVGSPNAVARASTTSTSVGADDDGAPFLTAISSSEVDTPLTSSHPSSPPKETGSASSPIAPPTGSSGSNPTSTRSSSVSKGTTRKPSKPSQGKKPPVSRTTSPSGSSDGRPRKSSPDSQPGSTTASSNQAVPPVLQDAIAHRQSPSMDSPMQMARKSPSGVFAMVRSTAAQTDEERKISSGARHPRDMYPVAVQTDLTAGVVERALRVLNVTSAAFNMPDAVAVGAEVAPVSAAAKQTAAPQSPADPHTPVSVQEARSPAVAAIAENLWGTGSLDVSALLTELHSAAAAAEAAPTVEGLSYAADPEVPAHRPGVEALGAGGAPFSVTQVLASASMAPTSKPKTQHHAAPGSAGPGRLSEHDPSHVHTIIVDGVPYAGTAPTFTGNRSAGQLRSASRDRSPHRGYPAEEEVSPRQAGHIGGPLRGHPMMQQRVTPGPPAPGTEIRGVNMVLTASPHSAQGAASFEALSQAGTEPASPPMPARRVQQRQTVPHATSAEAGAFAAEVSPEVVAQIQQGLGMSSGSAQEAATVVSLTAAAPPSAPMGEILVVRRHPAAPPSPVAPQLAESPIPGAQRSAAGSPQRPISRGTAAIMEALAASTATPATPGGWVVHPDNAPPEPFSITTPGASSRASRPARGPEEHLPAVPFTGAGDPEEPPVKPLHQSTDAAMMRTPTGALRIAHRRGEATPNLAIVNSADASHKQQRDDGQTVIAVAGSNRVAEARMATIPGLQHMQGHATIPGKEATAKFADDSRRDPDSFLQQQVLYRDEGGELHTVGQDDWHAALSMYYAAMRRKEQLALATQQPPSPDNLDKHLRMLQRVDKAAESKQVVGALATPRVPKAPSTPSTSGPAVDLGNSMAHDPVMMMASDLASSKALQPVRKGKVSGRTLVSAEALPPGLEPRVPHPIPSGVNEAFPPPSRLRGAPTNVPERRGGSARALAALSPRRSPRATSPHHSTVRNVAPLVEPPRRIDTATMKQRIKKYASKPPTGAPTGAMGSEESVAE